MITCISTVYMLLYSTINNLGCILITPTTVTMPIPVPTGGAVGLRTEVEFRLQGGQELVQVGGYAIGPGGQGLLAGRLVQIKCKILSIQYIWRKVSTYNEVYSFT